MALKLQDILNAPVIEVDVIDSTNNYAMSLINADTAQAGLTVIAKTQTGGKGQRGKIWFDTPEQCLLMSIVTEPDYGLEDQFVFNAVVTLSIVDILEDLLDNCRVQIKWPNDIIINDKKAGGVLLENVIRGNSWQYSIVGIGVNVLQDSMAVELPYATSLKLASGKKIRIWDLMTQLRDSINTNVHVYRSVANTIERYNHYLYRRDKVQAFSNVNEQFEANVVGVSREGELELKMPDGGSRYLKHGEVIWDWGR